MPLETATYISDLVTSNPAASDGMNNADDHMRLIKAAVKATFPSITGAVTATHTDLNNAAAFLAGTVVSKVPLGTVALPGYAFIGDLDTGMWSPGANRIAWSVGGVLAAEIAADKAATFAGSVAALDLRGPGQTPVGGVIIWPSDTLPPTSEGVWAWCNGAAYSKTTYATCFARIGNSVDATNFAVPNYQEVALVGKSTMGGAASPGLLPSIAAGVKGVLNALFGADSVSLQATHIPTITGTVSAAGTMTGSTSSVAVGNGNTTTPGGGFGCVSSISYSAASVSVSGSVSGSFSSTNTGGASPTGHANVQPSRVTNFIIRLA